MEFKESFNKSNDIWHYGEKNMHSYSGEMWVRDKWIWPNFCISILPTVINPDVYSDCEIAFNFKFGEKVRDGKALFVLFKKYHWSPEKDSKLKIYTDLSGDCEIFCEEKSMGKFKLEKNGDIFNVCLRVDLQSGFIAFKDNSGQFEYFTLSLDSYVSGYFGFSHIDEASYYVKDFYLKSDLENVPYNDEKYKEEIYLFQSECAEFAEKRAEHIIKKYEKNIKENLKRPEIIISEQLVNKGEIVNVKLVCYGEDKDNSAIIYQPDYFKSNKKITVKPLWKKSEGGYYSFDFNIKTDITGNYKIVWFYSGKRITRVFGVIDGDSTVCIPWVGAQNAYLFDRQLKRYDLPGDYHVFDGGRCIFDFDDDEYVSILDLQSRGHWEYGDCVSPFIAGANIIMKDTPDYNLFDFPYDLQFRVLKALNKIWDVFNVGKLKNVGFYTHNSDTIKALNQIGINSLDSVCVWQNSEDYGWNINHTGCPIVPYFSSDEDFRKVGNLPVVSSSMGTATSVRSYDIYMYDGSPSNISPSQRYSGNMAQHFGIERYFNFIEGLMHSSKYFNTPLFIVAGLESFCGWMDWEMANEIAIDFLAYKASTQNFVFSVKTAVADYYNKNYKGKQPFNIFYQEDTYCGIKHYEKPSVLPDRMEVFDSRMHCLFHKNRNLPVCFWNYTKLWEEKEWGKYSNRKTNAMPPENIYPNESVPNFTDLSNISIVTEYVQEADGIKVEVSGRSESDYDFLPIALWDIPIKLPDGSFYDEKNLHFCTAPSTGNLCAVLELENIAPGEFSTSIKIQGAKNKNSEEYYKIGDAFTCKYFNHDKDKTLCIIWSDDEYKDKKVSLTLNGVNDEVHARLSDGKTIYAENNNIEIKFNGTWETESVYLFGLEIDKVDYEIFKY